MSGLGAAALVLTLTLASGTEELQRAFVAAVDAAQRGDRVAAEPVFRDLIADYPGFAPAWIELAALLRWDGRADEALRCAEEAVRVASSHPLPELERARALLALGRPSLAVAAFRASITKRDMIETRMELASLLARQRRPDLAELEVRAALVLEPGSAKARGALGRILFYSKRYEEAAAAFAAAEGVGLRDAALMIEHGVALENLARLEEAGAVYELAAGRFPDDPGPLRRLGAVLLELDRAGEAVEPLEKALAIEPEDVPTMERLAHARYRDGREEGVLPVLQAAVELAPDFARAYYTLGTVLTEQGREGEGEVALLRFQALHSAQDGRDHREGKIATLNRQGLTQMRGGKLLEAIDTLEAAIRLGPTQGAVHKNLGLALLAAGNAAGAIDAFIQARSIDGGGEGIDELLARARTAVETGIDEGHP